MRSAVLDKKLPAPESFFPGRHNISGTIRAAGCLGVGDQAAVTGLTKQGAPWRWEKGKSCGAAGIAVWRELPYSLDWRRVEVSERLAAPAARPTRVCPGDLPPGRIFRLNMVKLDEFRTGQYSVPFGCADELPDCCFACVYLIYDDQETGACLCDSPSFYFCAYSWPDKLTQTVPPCLS